MGKLAGRVAIVTGGASGTGAAHSRILAEHGATVAVCDINIELGGALANEVGGAFYRLDVCDEQERAQVLDGIAARHGPVTILVNNAGKGLVAAIQDTTRRIGTRSCRSTLRVHSSGYGRRHRT